MVDDESRVTSLTGLPNDIFVVIFQYSSLPSLWALSQTCRALYDLVSTTGWSTHQRVRDQRALSWVPACLDDAPGWTPRARLRYDALATRNLRSRTFVARPLIEEPWFGRRIPILALGPARTRFAVGAWTELYVYRFEARDGGDGAPKVLHEGTYTVMRQDELMPLGDQHVNHDITSLAFVPGAGVDCTLFAGFADGYVMRLTLPEHAASADSDAGVKAEALYRHDVLVESLSVSDNIMFSLSGTDGRGLLSTFTSESDPGSSGSPEPCVVNFGKRCWTSLFSSRLGGPFLAIGSSSALPLSLHALLEGTFAVSARPTILLGMKSGALGPGKRRSRAVYALAHAPPDFPGAHPGAMLVSGWYDGAVRLYDVRLPSVTHYHDESAETRAPVLAPVMTLRDSWQNESIYAIATGGPAGTTVAAGAARHSVVAFWDVRNSRRAQVSVERVDGGSSSTDVHRRKKSGEGDGDDGWSVHAPANDPSPVYTLALAGARCFGATQSRPFVFDFGGRAQELSSTSTSDPTFSEIDIGVRPDTYPPIRLPTSKSNSRVRSRAWAYPKDVLPPANPDDVHYPVTMYTHRMPLARDPEPAAEGSRESWRG